MSDHARRRARLGTLPILALAVAACTAAGGTVTVPPDGSTPEPSPGRGSPAAAAQIDHPTGPNDVILRYEEGGGFVMASFAATTVPHFTLYGDGTMVFRDPGQEFVPTEGSAITSPPLRTARIHEDQIQELLRLALEDAGLADARPEYGNDMVADASTAVFTIDADGLQKSVSIYALGLEGPGVADVADRAGFARLAETLTSIEEGGGFVARDFKPAAYRGILFESPDAVFPDVRDWPWPDIAPADFRAETGPDSFGFPHRVLTPADVEELGVEGYLGGVQNVPVQGPDGDLYTISVRPLLPDEAP